MKVIYPLFNSLILSLLLITSCMSSQQALDKGHYQRAQDMALRQILKGKDVAVNQKILKEATDKIVEKTINQNAANLSSNDMKKWIRTQDKYYNKLKKIGQVNRKSDGAVTESYDRLCNAKNDLDHKIIDTYYNWAMDKMNHFDASGSKQSARDAHFNWTKCKEAGGTMYDLEDNLKESHREGIVYFTSNGIHYNSSFWLQPLPRDAEFDPDCHVSVSIGFPDTDRIEKENVVEYEKDIVVGHETHVDTSGNTTTTPIYETIEGEVTTTTYTWTTTHIARVYVDNVTGQCTIPNDDVVVQVEEEKEQIEFSGDRRAIPPHIIEKSVNVFFNESDMESEARRKLNRALNL